jgi:ABC-2 type transport system ATP-binding protein
MVHNNVQRTQFRRLIMAIVASGLRKRFGATEALRGLDLTVPGGTVCGLLGPNGAGKTTAVRILATLTTPDAGAATVAGFDVLREPDRVRASIAYCGQSAALDIDLTGRENLMMIGRLRHIGAAGARARTAELLKQFSLNDAADRPVRTYSGGMIRRLDLLAALMTRPEVLFLDEPTAGLDPRSRNQIWDLVRSLASDGVTVLLTTQYLDEADQLANDIAVVDHGAVVASGPSFRLKEKIGVRVEVLASDAAGAARVLTAVTGAAAEVSDTGASAVTRDAVTLPEVVRALDAAGVEAVDVALRQPTLDEVFFALTGSPA